MTETSIIVIGSLNTDIVAKGVTRFPKPGEHVHGEELFIGPGGKSRNIAAMTATLLPRNQVAMISRTTYDPYGLGMVPMKACKEAGVNTDFIKVIPYSGVHKLPAATLIPVDKEGNNQIIFLPGISDDFSPQDIDQAEQLFHDVANNRGLLVVTLECPLSTALHAIKKAVSIGIRVVFDPGGIEDDTNLDEFLHAGLYLIKPNEHEAQILTGVEVKDFASAKSAAEKLIAMGIENVFITVGLNGGYLFSARSQLRIPIPTISDNGIKDETGCGDQTIATLCAYMQMGSSLENAAKVGILAGTLQFHKQGIQPLSKQAIESSSLVS